MKTIETYFSNISEIQRGRFEALFELYKYWNSKINLISRKDIDNLYLHHLVHSLAIAKYITFAPGSEIMDLGTGGGLPGIPLAIYFPEVSFLLLDSIGKKVRAAEEIAKSIGLTNVTVAHSRAEDEKRRVHFVVSRAVMPLPDLVRVATKNISKEQFNPLPNGIISLKGGDLRDEISPFRKIAEQISLNNYFSELFFQTKKLIYIPII